MSPYQIEASIGEAALLRKLWLSGCGQHVIQLFDFEIKPDRVMLLMELGDECFWDYLDKHKIIPERDCKLYFSQMVQIVATLKANRIVHCDIKPENFVMFNNGTTLKVIDFAFAFQMPPGQTRAFRFPSGTKEYMAPEQRPHICKTDNAGYAAWNLIGFQVDIYALGVALYEMTQGATPTSVQHFGRRTVHENKEVQQLIEWMLQYDESMRPTITQVMFHPYLVNE